MQVINKGLATVGIGAASAAIGGIAFHTLHKQVLHLPDDAVQRATPGPIMAFGAIGLAVGATSAFGLHVSDVPKLRLAQGAITGAAIFAGLTLASPQFHGTKQPLPVSVAVNAGLGAAVGGAIYLATRRL